ncbi:MAG: sugar ABC transporter ATP-binding protein, partial [Chloroflexota bacterium]
VGHNGAGKSTLLSLLSGADRPDSGEILMDGNRLELRSPKDAFDKGIACVYQELSTINNLTVAQTLFLGRERVRNGVILNIREMEREAGLYLEEFNLRISPSAKIRDLTVAQRQLIEVITSLHRNARFLLLDEPTSSLEARQIDEMLAIIRDIASTRAIGVLLVDHKLDEVYAVADRVTALRNGQVILTGTTRSVPRAELIRVVIGERADREKPLDGANTTPSVSVRSDRGREMGLLGATTDRVALRVRGL